MDITLSKEDAAEALGSIKRFFREEIEVELTEIQARVVQKYFFDELAPFAYNKGVSDAEKFMSVRLEDLKSSCCEQTLTYWSKSKKRSS
jgi:uncharacterized protein (DUF2164 family)